VTIWALDVAVPRGWNATAILSDSSSVRARSRRQPRCPRRQWRRFPHHMNRRRQLVKKAGIRRVIGLKADGQIDAGQHPSKKTVGQEAHVMTPARMPCVLVDFAAERRFSMALANFAQLGALPSSQRCVPSPSRVRARDSDWWTGSSTRAGPIARRLRGATSPRRWMCPTVRPRIRC